MQKNYYLCLKQITRLLRIFFISLIGLAMVAKAEPTADKDEIVSIEGITIIGEKQNRTVLETYSSFEIKTEKQLQERAIFNLEDALIRTPGVTTVGSNNGFAHQGHTGLRRGRGRQPVWYHHQYRCRWSGTASF